MDLKTALSSQHCNDIGQNELIANQHNYTRLQDADIYCLFVYLMLHKMNIVKPKSSPKSKSQIQVLYSNPKSKIQSPEERDWDWGWHYNPILQATTPPPHPPITFLTSHLKCPSSVRIRPSPNEFALNSKA